ncbi:MAG: alpha/beta hydrolase, partial [Aeromicrobium sp.]|uniref:alpha/beta fold hydrolase n=1 Tax=Aeromicrobium sp. TaxID=1871063 RepID=UPI003C35DF99
MPRTPDVHYAKGSRGHLGFWAMGDGPPIIGWPGGMISARSVFDEPRCAHMERQIATFATMICMDRQGLGYSDPLAPGEGPTLERQGEDLLAVMDSLGAASAAVWANAWDAQALMLLAAAHPERVSKLIITSSTPCPVSSPDWAHGVPDDVLAALKAELDAPGSGHGPGDLSPLMAPSGLGDQSIAEWIIEGGQAGPTTAAAYLTTTLSADVRASLGAIAAPTLILHNLFDQWVPIEAARFMAKEIPHARLVEYDSADHLVFTTHLDEKLSEMEAFIERADQPRVNRRLLTVLFTDVVGSTERLAATVDA